MASKDERLLNLIAALLSTSRPLSAREIQELIEGYRGQSPQAFHRAFERDKEELRQQEIPLRIERVSGTDPAVEGYRIPPDEYYLPDPGLEPDELAALHLASQAVRMESGNRGQEAILKLGGDAGGGGGGLGADGGLAVLPAHPALTSLFGAMSAHQQVAFTYKEVERRVDPWWLDFQRGRWYLTGFDHVRGAERNFRLDRIDGSVEAAGQMVEPAPPRPPDGPPKPWELGDADPVEATMLVDASHTPEAQQWLGADATAKYHDDGSATFTVGVANPDAFRSFLFAFLEHAELLGPAEWRDDVVRWLEAVEAGGSDGSDGGSRG